jgi:uncharacterized protein
MSQPSTRLIKLHANMPGDPSEDQPKPDRQIRGQPKRQTWNLVDEALPAGRCYSGIWSSEVGQWRIAMGPTERELFTVIAGRCRVHDAHGGFEEAGPGEGIYIPAGFEGSFEVLEALTKTYMICE